MLRGLQGWHLLLMLVAIAGFIAFWVVVALLVRMLIQEARALPHLRLPRPTRYASSTSASPEERSTRRSMPNAVA